MQGEIVIDRPPDEVFDFVADEENEPRYNPEMRFAKKVTEGPIGVGTSFRAEMTGRGRVVPMTILFTEYDRPRRIAERVQMKAMDLTGDLTFEPFDGGTRMRWSWNLEPHGVLGSWARPSRGWVGARSRGSGPGSSISLKDRWHELGS